MTARAHEGRLPGIYLAPEGLPTPTGLERDASCRLFHVPGFRACACGALADHAENDAWLLLMEGVLVPLVDDGRSDAAAALAAFTARGVEGLHEIEGFFNILLLRKDGSELHFLGDVMATRPWYSYRDGPTLALAPTPLFFAELGLGMSPDRQGIFELLTFHHPMGARSLVREVQRIRPLHSYHRSEEGELATRPTFALRKTQRMNDAREAAARFRSDISAILGDLLRHPRLGDRAIHLPLTGGMDSRHILGELLDQGRPPELIRHVRWVESEFRPVERIAEKLGLPLEAPRIPELDLAFLSDLWMRRSAGLLHFHQVYLLFISSKLPPAGVLGFDGYLMDRFYGLVLPRGFDPDGDPRDMFWRRSAVPPIQRRWFFADADELARESDRTMEAEMAPLGDDTRFQFGFYDVLGRGLHYTGGAFPLGGDEALYFAPGAHRRGLEYYLDAAWEEIGEKRARLLALREAFPELAREPGPEGVPYAQLTSLGKPTKTKPGRGSWLKWILTAGGTDLRPDSEHTWPRRLKAWRRPHALAVRDSHLVRDGVIDARGPRRSWRLMNRGIPQAWPLMAFLTAEIAYRLLVEREPVEELHGRFFGSGDPTPK